MTQPLALLYYEKILPGTQLFNRLQDMGYRVQACRDVGDVVGLSESEKPLLVFLDLVEGRGRVPGVIKALKKNEVTAHLPVIAFAPAKETQLQEYARMAGATLVINEEILMAHLEGFLDQALQVD